MHDAVPRPSRAKRLLLRPAGLARARASTATAPAPAGPRVGLRARGRPGLVFPSGPRVLLLPPAGCPIPSPFRTPRNTGPSPFVPCSPRLPASPSSRWVLDPFRPVGSRAFLPPPRPAPPSPARHRPDTPANRSSKARAQPFTGGDLSSTPPTLQLPVTESKGRRPGRSETSSGSGGDGPKKSLSFGSGKHSRFRGASRGG